MPTYDYTCAACGHRFERFESINDGGPKPCPSCNKKKAKRMLGTGAGVIFKGAGFYTTDSKSTGKPSSAGSSESSSGESEKKSESKDKKKKEEKESKK